MKLLAIETASPPGSIALLDSEAVLAAEKISSTRKTTQHFALLIQSLLENVGWTPKDVGLVSTTTGPGSFTGLRIGVTAAKAFAYALDLPVVGVNTLEVIAAQCPPTELPIESVLDAQRNQLFAARFRQVDGFLRAESSTQIIDVDTWFAERATGALLIGPGLEKHRDRLSQHQVADELHWVPTAATLGRLAYKSAREQRTVQPVELVPRYYRLSAAEEKLRATERTSE